MPRASRGKLSAIRYRRSTVTLKVTGESSLRRRREDDLFNTRTPPHARRNLLRPLNPIALTVLSALKELTHGIFIQSAGSHNWFHIPASRMFKAVPIHEPQSETIIESTVVHKWRALHCHTAPAHPHIATVRNEALRASNLAMVIYQRYTRDRVGTVPISFHNT